MKVRRCAVLMLLMVCGLGCAPWPAFGLDDGVARTPPMGWHPYNTFGDKCLDEAALKAMADSMVSNGLVAAGYVYFGPDCGWSAGPDAQGILQPQPAKFPGGIKALADYLHARGMKYVMYADAGSKGCCGKEYAYPNYKGNAAQWAQWGVDYLKLDWCGGGAWQGNTTNAYTTMREALQAAGRPVCFSLCEWGTSKPWTWAKTVGHMWRTTGDIARDWNSWMSIYDANKALAEYAGPGHWNDPDMLMVGVGATTLVEQQSHFTLWCIMAAPLILGMDVREMSPAVKAIVTNPEVLAVDQDRLGRQGRVVRARDGQELLVKPLRDGSTAVVLFNRSPAGATMSFTLPEIGLAAYSKARVRDLWEHADKGVMTNAYSVAVASHEAKMLKVTPKGWKSRVRGPLTPTP